METSSKKSNGWKVAFIVLASFIGFVVLAAVILPAFMTARHSAGRRTPGTANIEKYRTPGKPTSQDAGLAYEEAGRSADATKSFTWSAAWAATTSRMVIRTADLAMKVSDVQKTHEKIADVVAKADGFLTESDINRDDSRVWASVTLRVPAKKYQSTLAEISKLGTVLSKEEEGQDVTEEYVDTQSRLRNLKREEEQFLKVLGRAYKVPDILAVERELARVRGEIERATGRIQFLENQVALATIRVQLSEPAPMVTAVVGWDISRTATGAVNALEVVLRAITSLVVWVAIFGAIWLPIGLVVYWIKRRSRRQAA